MASVLSSDAATSLLPPPPPSVLSEEALHLPLRFADELKRAVMNPLQQSSLDLSAIERLFNPLNTLFLLGLHFLGLLF